VLPLLQLLEVSREEARYTEIPPAGSVSEAAHPVFAYVSTLSSSSRRQPEY